MILPRRVVLNERAGHGRGKLPRVQKALTANGLDLVEMLRIGELEKLPAWIALPDGERPLIVAAGGDGTVGAVANYVANTPAVLGILPLGTSNDVARSLRVPMRLEDAVALLAGGKVVAVDAGRMIPAHGAPRYFVHAAAAGLNVTFARMATRTSWRKRLGRLTYLVSATAALRDHQVFSCTLALPERTVSMRLLHLSVVNAPIFGGFLRLRLSGSDVDDRRLDILAIESAAPYRLILAGLALVLGKSPRVGGVHLYHVRRFTLQVEQPLEVSLDGELAGTLPGEFVLAPNALRVMAPLDFVDREDP